MTRLIDADALKESIDEHVYIVHHGFNETEYGCTQYGIHQIIDEQPTVDAIPISFIEEQVKLCNEIGFRRGEECYMALIEDLREKNGTETD